jgi:hypothetical protein
MGNVMGFYMQLPDEKSIYISSDTIYIPEVQKVLKTYQPELVVVAAGSAQMDMFQPLLMKLENILRFVNDAPGKVLANHMEAVNHCPTTRQQLKAALAVAGTLHKVYIPEDGECIDFN